MERKEGYYWVKMNGSWTIAEWAYQGNDGQNFGWDILANAFPWEDSDTDEINETRIRTPDEDIARSQMYQQLLEQDRLKQALFDATALLRTGTSEPMSVDRTTGFAAPLHLPESERAEIVRNMKAYQDNFVNTTVRFDLITAHKAGFNKHPVTLMKQLGYTLLNHEAGEIGDCVFMKVKGTITHWPEFLGKSNYQFLTPDGII